jgi:hypothetical protein
VRSANPPVDPSKSSETVGNDRKPLTRMCRAFCGLSLELGMTLREFNRLPDQDCDCEPRVVRASPVADRKATQTSMTTPLSIEYTGPALFLGLAAISIT